MKYMVLDYGTGSHEQFEATTLNALRSGREVVVNLDGLTSIEIEDIQRLIKLLRQSRNMGTEFALRATRPQVRKALAVTALDRIFTLVEADAA